MLLLSLNNEKGPDNGQALSLQRDNAPRRQ
jgi:hypothetical protein